MAGCVLRTVAVDRVVFGRQTVGPQRRGRRLASRRRNITTGGMVKVMVEVKSGMILSFFHVETVTSGAQCSSTNEHDDVHTRFTQHAVNHSALMIALRSTTLPQLQTGRTAGTLVQQNARRDGGSRAPAAEASRRAGFAVTSDSETD